MSQEQHEFYMRRAIELAKAAAQSGTGGPFAAVIVKDGRIVGEGANRVIAERDPTWHGEIGAIRDACRNLRTHDLSGAVLYTTGECCPMCYAAAWWARISRIYYASTYEDARVYGDFDDDIILEALKLPNAERKLPCLQILREEMLDVWKAFAADPNRVHY